MTRLPVFEADVMILELSLDDNDACREFCPATEYPIDVAQIKIKEIFVVDNPDNMTIEPYRNGDEISVEFQYSARPAKLRPDSAAGNEETPPEERQPGILLMPGPVPVEDGYFIYDISSADEEILPGVQDGITLRAKIIYLTAEKGVISTYQIID